VIIDFSEWEKETLIRFAYEVNERNKQLEEDIKTVFEAYRKLVTENARKTD